MHTTCPECHAVYEFKKPTRDTRVTCKHCHTEFLTPVKYLDIGAKEDFRTTKKRLKEAFREDQHTLRQRYRERFAQMVILKVTEVTLSS